MKLLFGLMHRTTAYMRLADLLLGIPLKEFVAERRANGRTWRLIARDLLDATNGEIDLTEQTLRTWFRDDEAESVCA